MIALEIKSKLPHGAIKEIAQRTNLSTSTISQVLNSKTKSPQLAEILKATAEVLKEFRDRERKALAELDMVLNEETPDELTARLNHQQEKYGEGSSPLL
ncbi:hypothetical protein [uncultured Sunxiuqinia sp.]|uniref:hypothetical protein n=1 Tax=uncultured Sunxiuqinia sp. TaxID=1573825 RepID=UPI002AA74C3A|nr:hypothetical protein [uncultured Sunxiuqinia sp.]